ncbi:MAG: 6-phosphogluconolactonase [Anditalea sp.]
MKSFIVAQLKLNVFNSRTAMGEAAGKAAEKKILELLSEKEEIRMVFAAAPSQNEFFAYLRSSSVIPWEKITAFHMDEYVGLPSEADPLFANFLKRNLFDQVNFKKVYLIDGNNNPKDECARYASLISEKQIDIVCLGIGENGHIAFNDPPVADFDDPAIIKKVELELACRQQQVNDGCFPSIKEVPEEALTLTIPTLMKAGYLFCIVPGALKREAVKNAVHGPVSTSCPASILQTHGQCELFVDIAAYPVDLEIHPVIEIQGINCLTEQPQAFKIQQTIDEISDMTPETRNLSYIGPGLVDLQVNGINGIDFNDHELTEEGMVNATHYLLGQGVTSYFPTLITNSDENILEILGTINKACSQNPLVNACIAGIHLEGPFLSPVDGARGAHDKQYIKAPSWDLVNTFQQASGRRIRLITLAPEWNNAPEFIERCRQEGILISIGHTNASREQIHSGVQAGATLSTHLGNGVPLMLPRHPNLLWEQLAKDELHISIIADGIHLPDSFLKVAMKVKGDKVLLVSDATCFSGMEPGEYKTHIGDEVVLNAEGKLALKNSNGLLAGATKSLLENIQYLINQDIVPLGKAWEMGSINPGKFLGWQNYGLFQGQPADMVVFHLSENNIRIDRVIKKGEVVYEQKK